MTYRSAHFITNPKVKTALLIHRVIDSRKFWEFGPIVFERVIKETVIGTVKKKIFHVIKCSFFFFYHILMKNFLVYRIWSFIQSYSKITESYLLRFLVSLPFRKRPIILIHPKKEAKHDSGIQ